MKIIGTLLLLLALSACGTLEKAQYAAYEKVGVHKRDILVDRIEDTSKTQEQTKVEFQSAYEQLASLVEVDDQGLEAKYKKLQSSLDRSEAKAQELDDRINSVDKVANALFEEWGQELELYQSASLKESSAKNLRETKKRYQVLLGKMRESQDKIDPVLRVLQDNTLFLKHNLNARAVQGISAEVVSVEDQVKDLIRDMEASIEESRSFIQSMEGSAG